MFLLQKNYFYWRRKTGITEISKRIFEKRKILKKKIENHLEKFAFVNKYYFWGEGLRMMRYIGNTSKLPEFGKIEPIKVGNLLNSINKVSYHL